MLPATLISNGFCAQLRLSILYNNQNQPPRVTHYSCPNGVFCIRRGLAHFGFLGHWPHQLIGHCQILGNKSISIPIIFVKQGGDS